MNNLDHVKNFYPENYKLDLSETMKAALSKGPPATGAGVVPSGVGGSNNATPVMGMGGGAPGAPHGDNQQGNTGLPGVGYVTEKLYMLLQLYLQNKGWNPSAELLQCFTDLKDNAMLPSAAYLQVLANRLTLDAQGRLILRENGKIVLPFEHFANAVMLKHMSGPHGLHLSVEATVRAVIESYTIGRENFGMEKEFIIEVVQSCPSPACRYYKNHLGMSPLPFMEQQFAGVNPAEFLQHLPHMPPPPPHPMSASNTGTGGVNVPSASNASNSNGSVNTGNNSGSNNSGEVDLTKSSQSHVLKTQMQHMSKQQQNSIQSQLSQISAAAAAAAAAAAQQQQAAQMQQQAAQQQQQAAAAAAAAAAAKQQQQITAALFQQQSRALAQQNLEKFNSLSPLDKQRLLQQLESKHFDPIAVAAAAANLQMQGIMQSQAAAVVAAAAAVTNAAASSSSSSCNTVGGGTVTNNPSTVTVPAVNAANVNNHHAHQLAPPTKSPTIAHQATTISMPSSSLSTSPTFKNVEILRPNNIESIESNKDLLALHNGAWGAAQDQNREPVPVGQDKIVRIFNELLRNMARMKTYIRPSMCKPYGKQSESLQKSLMDTIQIVQTLRNCLPAPHIPVSSWKSESSTGVPAIVAVNNTGNVAGEGAIANSRVENLSN